MIYTSALILGLMGSLHCVGMCGPLVLAMPYGKYGFWKSNSLRLLYNIGRISSYLILGLILGIFSNGFKVFVGQQYFSLALGLSILLIVFTPARFKPNFIILLESKFRKLFGKFIQSDKWYMSLSTGLMNGLLPCGLVWFAILAAMNMGNWYESALYMSFFGIGTIPALYAVSLFRNIKSRISSGLLSYAPKFLALSIVLMLTIRGLGFGTHFSPENIFKENIEKVITVCGFD